MKSGKQIYEIIQKLSKSEKRTFKLYISTYKSTKDNKSALLFDAFNKMEEYDIEALHKISPPKNIVYDLFRLRNLLINTLCDIKYNTGKLDSPGEIINRIELGLELGLNDLVFENLKKGYKLAKNSQNNAFHLYLLQYESTFEEHQANVSKLVSLDKEIIQQTQEWSQKVSYSQIWKEVYLWFIENYDKEEKQELHLSTPHLSKLFYSPSIDESASNHEKICFFKAKAFYFDLKSDFKACLDIYEKLVDIYLTMPDKTQDLIPPLYNIVYYNLLFDNPQAATHQLEKADLLSKDEKYEIPMKIGHSLISCLIFSYSEDYPAIIAQENKIEEYYQIYLQKKDSNEVFTLENWGFCFILAFFKTKQYNKCLDWIEKIKNLQEVPAKTQTTSLTTFHFIEVFCHIELNNQTLLHSLHKRIQYYLKVKESPYSEEEQAVLSIIKAITQGSSFTISKPLRQPKKTNLIAYVFYKNFMPYFESKQRLLNTSMSQ